LRQAKARVTDATADQLLAAARQVADPLARQWLVRLLGKGESVRGPANQSDNKGLRAGAEPDAMKA
jgi:hypothetical protein